MRFVSKMSSVLLVGKVAIRRVGGSLTRVLTGLLDLATVVSFIIGTFEMFSGDIEGAASTLLIGIILMAVSSLVWSLRLSFANLALRKENERLRNELARYTRPSNVIPFPAKGGDLNA